MSFIEISSMSRRRKTRRRDSGSFSTALSDGDQVVDLGVQFSGIPAGYEFSTLINDIILASKRDGYP